MIGCGTLSFPKLKEFLNSHSPQGEEGKHRNSYELTHKIIIHNSRFIRCTGIDRLQQRIGGVGRSRSIRRHNGFARAGVNNADAANNIKPSGHAGRYADARGLDRTSNACLSV